MAVPVPAYQVPQTATARPWPLTRRQALISLQGVPLLPPRSCGKPSGRRVQHLRSSSAPQPALASSQRKRCSRALALLLFQQATTQQRHQQLCSRPHPSHAASQGQQRSVVTTAASATAIASTDEPPEADQPFKMAPGDSAAPQSPASMWLPFKPNSAKERKHPASLAGRLQRYARLLVQLPGYLWALLVFNVQQVLLRNTLSKLAAVFLAGIPACLLGGALYSLTSGKPLVDGVVNAYGALYKIPGVMVLGEINIPTTHVMNVLWLCGTFTFATVLGFITEDIVNYVMSIRTGNYPVVAENHTLILNWNRETLPLLRQIAISHIERKTSAYSGPVVILAEREKEAMDEEVRRALRGYELEWHTRCGCPHSSADLERVAAGQAHTIVLLHPEEHKDAGKKQVAAVLGIQSARASTRPRPFLKLMPQNIAVQASDDQQDRTFLRAAREIMEASSQRFHLNDLSGRRDMSVLQAQSILQPGVASVFSCIVQQTREDVEFYTQAFPQFAGKAYKAARQAFEEALVVGYLCKAEKQLHVNPPDDAVLQEGDRIIALAKSAFFEPLRTGRALAYSRTTVEQLNGVPPKAAASPPQQIVVLWWEEDLADLAVTLGAAAPKGSTVTIVSPTKPKGFPEKAAEYPGVKFSHIEGDPGDLEVLRKAQVESADSIALGCIQGRDRKEADSVTISVVLLLQDLIVQRGRAPDAPAHLVAMIERKETVEVINFLIGKLGKGTVTAELLLPEELVSGIISQVAAEPDLGPLLSGFLQTTAGQDIFLTQPTQFGLAVGTCVSFAQVAELVRRQAGTAIGYITYQGQLILAPPVERVREFVPGDRVIVIADAATGGAFQR